MSTNAIRFAPRTRAQRGIRTGMLAYLGLAAQVQAERDRAAKEALMHAEQAKVAAEEAYMWAQVEKPVAATPMRLLDGTLVYRTHYGADVTVTRRSRKHIVLKARY